MNKEEFLHVWDIYRQHWGQENTKIRIHTHGLTLLKSVLDENASWFKKHMSMTTFINTLANDDSVQSRENFDHTQLLSDILMGLPKPTRKIRNKHKIHYSTLWNWKDRFGKENQQLDEKTIYNVYAITALYKVRNILSNKVDFI